MLDCPDWSSMDTARQAVYYVLHAADWQQTRYITKSQDHEESNQLLGLRPSIHRVDTYFAVTAVMHGAISCVLKPKYRQAWQYVTIGFETGSVAHNISAGVRFDF